MNQNNVVGKILGSKIPKQLLAIVVGVIVLIFLFSRSFVYVNPGNVGIFVNRLNGEIDTKPLESGFKFKLIGFQDIVEYPIYMQTLILSKASTEGANYNEEINVNSIEGQPVSCDVSLSFELDPTKVPALYVTFRQNINEITQGFVKQTIRQIMQQVVGNVQVADFIGRAKSSIVTEVQKEIQQRLNKYGFVIKQFTINEIRPPETVLKAIESKNIMSQEALKSKNQLKKVQFEAQQQVEKAVGISTSILTEAQSQSEANKILSKSITPTLVRYKAIEKWSGKLSEIGSTQMPFVGDKNIGTPSKK
ncbi:MAG: prohibitin family protein [Candidatus Sericytochromatia bacterium]|nr:prohibitin family protein [Candidatus Sericytochromatia bacterium]